MRTCICVCTQESILDYKCIKCIRCINHKIVDYDLVLDAKFGKEGTPERIQAEEAAYSFYSGQILQNARKEAKVTQEELARRTNTTKSYISNKDLSR